MRCTRRDLLAMGAGSLMTLAAGAEPAKEASRQPLGMVIHSYGIRRAADKDRGFADPLAFLDYCHTLGAAGVQTSLGVRDDAAAGKLRDAAAGWDMYIEGVISLPRESGDVDRFADEVRTAKRCGATVFRTVLMNGRRYEVFDSAEAFAKFLDQARQSLALSRPIVEKHEVRMAVENHKDLQAAQQVEVIKKLDCPFIGICVDTGNNLALLEKPQETVDSLAPHAFTTHLKDMGVEDYADGFLLSEVPLGTGFLDVAKIIATLRHARPDIHLNLEMITRDPLKIPCLTPKYWATLDKIPGRQLAEILALVRAKGKNPLPRVGMLSRDEQFKREDENVRQCLRFAKEHLEGP